MKNIKKLILAFFVISLNIQNFAYAIDECEYEGLTFGLKQTIGNQLITAVTSRDPQEVGRILNDPALIRCVSCPHAKRAFTEVQLNNHQDIVQALMQNERIQTLICQSQEEEDEYDYPFDVGEESDEESGKEEGYEDCHLGDNN